MTHQMIPNPVQTPSINHGKTAGLWPTTLRITPSKFVHKSLCDWSLNLAVGCHHGCLFCYVPSTATNKQKPKLTEFGVTDPDRQWGNYVLVKRWGEDEFIQSLLKAELQEKLKPDGNRAVLLCTTSDPYQVISGVSGANQLNDHARSIVRRSLELIAEYSTINVRVLTRSPLAERDFDLFKRLGNRLMLGVSIPTLNNGWARVYEPGAPAPSRRLELLQAAKEAGVNTFVALAPTYPECNEADLEATLRAVSETGVLTIFHEPINIRAENVSRIKAHAEELGVELQSHVFNSTASWRRYSVSALFTVQRLATKLKIQDRLHLWPDPDLEFTKREKEKLTVDQLQQYSTFLAWRNACWSRVSEWPGKAATSDWIPPQLPAASPFDALPPESAETPSR